ncbi:MAG TPA: hypothetical protein VGW40_06805 [Allosphingosinicella sp.]|nr:hypothetical protein [Allosphingosinicella sp.]
MGIGVRPDRITDLTPRDTAFYANQIMSGMAGALASAGARSLIQGADFGDNLIAALPDVIGNTIGNLIADGASGGGGRGPAVEKEPQSENYGGCTQLPCLPRE